MFSMATSSPPFRFQPPHRNWFERNPWWKFAFGALVLVLLIAAGVWGPVITRAHRIHKSDVYQQSVKRATSNLEVRASLGEPVETAWLVSGELNDQLAKLSIPISGPKGKGMIHVVAAKSYGV